MREPAIFWGPELIKPGLVSELGSTMDLFSTFTSLAGVEIPNDRIIDGKDISQTLLNREASPRKSILFYRGTELYAARLGDFKAHYITQGAYGEFGERKEHNPPLLYNLSHDASEKFDISKENPAIISQINALVEEHNSNLIRGKDQLAERE